MSSNNQKPKKTLFIDSVPDKPIMELEISEYGLQAWGISPPEALPTPCVYGMPWSDVEKALVYAIENGHYKPEVIHMKSKDK
jgi:hypothetical protein